MKNKNTPFYKKMVKFEGQKVVVIVVENSFPHHGDRIVGILGKDSFGTNYQLDGEWWIREQYTNIHYILKDYIVIAVKPYERVHL